MILSLNFVVQDWKFEVIVVLSSVELHTKPYVHRELTNFPDFSATLT